MYAHYKWTVQSLLSLIIAYQPFVTGVSVCIVGGKKELEVRVSAVNGNTCRYHTCSIYGTEVEGLVHFACVATRCLYYDCNLTCKEREE